MGLLSNSGVPSSSKVPMPAPSGFPWLWSERLSCASNNQNAARTRRGPPLIPHNRHITLPTRRLASIRTPTTSMYQRLGVLLPRRGSITESALGREGRQEAYLAIGELVAWEETQSLHSRTLAEALEGVRRGRQSRARPSFLTRSSSPRSNGLPTARHGPTLEDLDDLPACGPICTVAKTGSVATARSQRVWPPTRNRDDNDDKADEG